MQPVAQPLPDDLQELKHLLLLERARTAEKEAVIDELKQRYQAILEQFRLAQQRQFGNSSESADQLGLFNESEAIIEAAAEDGVKQDRVGSPRSKPKRKPLPRSLPRETIVHDIEDKHCTCCGNELHRMSEEKSEQLEFIPAQVKVIEHIRPKYGCRYCERHGTEVKIQIAPTPSSPIPKSIATASLLAQVITSKYQYALPLYRQEQMFRQFEIDLNRKTLAQWMIRCAELLRPLYQQLKAVQLQQTVIQADETPLKVIHEEKSRCYMWLYCTGTDSLHPGQANAHSWTPRVGQEL